MISEVKTKRPNGRETLLAACEVLFLSAGYSRVSVADILEESGLKAPSLYHHFGDKEGLYRAWVLRTLGRSEEALRRAVEGAPRGRALAAVATVACASDFPDVLEMLRDLSSLSEPGQAEVRAALQSCVYGWVERALELSGEPESPQRTAMATLIAHALAASRSRYVGDKAGGECPLGLLSRAVNYHGSQGRLTAASEDCG